MDRLITIHVDYFDRDTEVAIAAARGGVSREDAGRVVDLVRHYRQRHAGRHRPSLRAAIMIARVVAQRGGTLRLRPTPSSNAPIATCSGLDRVIRGTTFAAWRHDSRMPDGLVETDMAGIRVNWWKRRLQTLQ